MWDTDQQPISDCLRIIHIGVKTNWQTLIGLYFGNQPMIKIILVKFSHVFENDQNKLGNYTFQSSICKQGLMLVHNNQNTGLEFVLCMSKSGLCNVFIKQWIWEIRISLLRWVTCDPSLGYFKHMVLVRWAYRDICLFYST